jgi:hypothetical protein
MSERATDAKAAPGKTSPPPAGARAKLRNPGLPEGKRAASGGAAGEECGVVRGRSDPCPRILLDDAGEARCPVHCRHPTRNVDALSELCPQYRMRGRTRCKRHGGNSRTGATHPGYTDGRRSRWAPHVNAARARLMRQLAEGDPLDLLDDLDLMRSRAAELVRSADAAGVPDWERALPLCRDARKAVSAADDATALRRLGELEGVLSATRSHERAWDQIDQALKATTKMAESQRKRAVETGKFVTADDVQDMLNQLGRSLKAKVEELLPKEQGDRLLTEVGRAWDAVTQVDERPMAEGTPAS